MTPESAAPTDKVLPEARLRFMNARRRTATERGPGDLAAHALLVHRVPGFMDRTEQALVEERTRHARGDADVIGAETAREGMGRDVLSPMLEVVAEPLDHPKRVGNLEVGVVIAMEDAVIDQVRVPPDVRHERDDRGFQL